MMKFLPSCELFVDVRYRNVREAGHVFQQNNSLAAA